jgi:hypothetical protein
VTVYALQVQDRHPEDGAAGIRTRHRVHHVVRADHQRHVRPSSPDVDRTVQSAEGWIRTVQGTFV